MKKKVRVLGAGISGLLSAYYAVQKGYDVEVYEASSAPGGKLQTLKGSHGLMETAANATLADLEVETVAKALGLTLLQKKSTARKRYIYFRGQISRWPLGFFETWRFVYFLFCWKTGIKSVEPQRRESLKTWSDRTLGATTTQALLSPGCLGIFGVGAEQLSAHLIYQYFFSQRKKEWGSLRGSVAPLQGMGQWITALEKYLQQKGVRLTYNSSDLRAEWNKEPLVVATDHQNAGKILEFYKDSRSRVLQSLPTVDLVSVNVFYQQRPPLQKPGFGVLFAREEDMVPLGVLFNQDIFSERSDVVSETWIFGPTNGDVHQPDEYYKTQIALTRQKIWQDQSAPLDLRINRWPKAIPLYGGELEQALESLPVSQGNIHLVGNYLGEIGLNRLFHRAKQLIESL